MGEDTMHRMGVRVGPTPDRGRPVRGVLIRRLACWLLPARRPPMWVGAIVAAALIALETAVVGLLHAVSSSETPRAVIYLVGVLVVASVWGASMGIATALASTVAFDYFYIPPNGLHLTMYQDVQLVLAFAVLALFGGGLASLARAGAEEARQRAAEAEATAGLARTILGDDINGGLRAGSRYLADRYGLPRASIELGDAERTGPDPPEVVLDLGVGPGRIGRLCLPAGTPPATCERLHERICPPLEAILRTALDRQLLLSSLRRSRERTEALLAEQMALRRVATMVAAAEPPDRVFSAVTAELCRLFTGFRTALARYEPNDEFLIVSERDEHGRLLRPCAKLPCTGDSIVAAIGRTGRTAQIDYDAASGPMSDRMRRAGVHRGMGVPIVVDGELWGAALILSVRPDPVPPGAETRLQAFTDLVATAIASAEHRAALAASRARLVTAGDDARRRIERDLHDGAQQRIMSLALQLRLAEDAGCDPVAVRHLLPETVQALTEIHQSLSDLARGIHPALLIQGGIGPILRTLARRSTVPVELDVCVQRRLPEPVEVAVYHVVCEALDNVAKHAEATGVSVAVAAGPQCVRLTVHDDGLGGADPRAGTGLVGLCDRVEALGGRLNVVSPPGRGTTLHAELPLAPAPAPLPAGSAPAGIFA